MPRTLKRRAKNRATNNRQTNGSRRQGGGYQSRFRTKGISGRQAEKRAPKQLGKANGDIKQTLIEILSDRSIWKRAGQAGFPGVLGIRNKALSGLKAMNDNEIRSYLGRILGHPGGARRGQTQIGGNLYTQEEAELFERLYNNPNPLPSDVAAYGALDPVTRYQKYQEWERHFEQDRELEDQRQWDNAENDERLWTAPHPAGQAFDVMIGQPRGSPPYPPPPAAPHTPRGGYGVDDMHDALVPPIPRNAVPSAASWTAASSFRDEHHQPRGRPGEGDTENEAATWARFILVLVGVAWVFF